VTLDIQGEELIFPLSLVQVLDHVYDDDARVEGSFHLKNTVRMIVSERELES
jgi:hypothetical protein